jgi:outer membrane protein assembly factor BamA
MFFRLRFLLPAFALICGFSCAWSEIDEKPAFSIIPLPFVFFQPETGFGGGAICMAVENSKTENLKQLLDSYRVVGLYTAEKQIEFAFSGEHYSSDNNLQVKLDADYIRSPGIFYGIGGPVQGLDEDYTTVGLCIDASMGFALARGLYLGPSFTFKNHSMIEGVAEGVLRNGDIEGASGARVLGPGLRLSYEGRDSPIAASRGYFADLSTTFSPEAIGASSTVSFWALDLRGYATPLEGYKAVIAGQVYTAFTIGDTPFQELPELGGDERLRGYIREEYRDKCMIMAQGEVRLPLWWRLGLALFGGVGQIGESYSGLSLDDVRFGKGFGIRFLIDKESAANLRIDLAWGDEGPEVYFQLGEAF